jgi:hypothetical protein
VWVAAQIRCSNNRAWPTSLFEQQATNLFSVTTQACCPCDQIHKGRHSAMTLDATMATQATIAPNHGRLTERTGLAAQGHQARAQKR